MTLYVSIEKSHDSMYGDIGFLSDMKAHGQMTTGTSHMTSDGVIEKTHDSIW